MALFIRNVVGSEILSMWRYVSAAGPVEHETLIARYYPGDATKESESDQRKTLNDAIEFLVEAEQFIDEGDGYRLTETAQDEVSPETALLWGIRSRDGEDAGYNDVLDVLTEDDRIFFNRQGSLVDLLDDRRSEVSWNSTRLNYWRRTMEALGLVRDLDTDTDEEYTSMLIIDMDLLYSLLMSVISPSEPAQLQQVLLDLNERYLPTFAGSTRNEVASYVQRALRQAQQTDLIELHQESDFGPTVEINGAGVNSITLRVKGMT